MPPTRRYAEGTAVTENRSRAEIEATLARYGATAFGYSYDSEANRAMIMFQVSGRRIRMDLPLPDPKDAQFQRIYRNKTAWDHATPAQARTRWDQGCRQAWRALALIVKAKLEAVAAGITTVEREFLAHVMLPDGSTVGQWIEPQIAAAYEQGTMPAILPGPGPQ